MKSFGLFGSLCRMIAEIKKDEAGSAEGGGVWVGIKQ